MASVVFHYVVTAYLHFSYPYSTFLFSPRYRFGDFFEVYRDAQRFHPGQSHDMVYSPLLHLAMTVFALVPPWVAFGVLVGSFFAVLLWVLWSWTTVGLAVDPLVRTIHVGVLALLAYPVLFAVDRGNLEMLVFILLAAFFWLYYARRSPWAWLPLGLAIAAKYYWVTLLVLLLLDREWRQAAWTAAAALVGTIAAAVILSAVSGYSLLRVGASLFDTLGGHVDLIGSVRIASHSHSLWSWVTAYNQWTFYGLFPLPLQRIYTLLVVLVFVLVVRRLVRGGLADWQKATALMVCALVLPFESKDYNLINLLLPLSMFVAVRRTGPATWVVASLFGLLFIPLDYYYMQFWSWPSAVSISSLIYPVILLALLGAALIAKPGEDGVSEDGGVILAEPSGERA